MTKKEITIRLQRR